MKEQISLDDLLIKKARQGIEIILRQQGSWRVREQVALGLALSYGLANPIALRLVYTSASEEAGK